MKVNVVLFVQELRRVAANCHDYEWDQDNRHAIVADSAQMVLEGIAGALELALVDESAVV